MDTWLISSGYIIPLMGGFHLWLRYRKNKSTGWGTAIIWMAATAFTTLAFIFWPDKGMYAAMKQMEVDWAPYIVMLVTCLMSLILCVIWLRNWRKGEEQQEYAHWLLLAAGAVNGLALGRNLLVVVVSFILLSLSIHRLFFAPELVADIRADREQRQHLDQ